MRRQTILQVESKMMNRALVPAAREAGRSVLATLGLLLAAAPAHASFLSGDAMAKAANVIAIVVLVVVPLVAIVAFWMVHVLPEKIAHQRHHPQRDAIQVLCLLSLVFGGMLWPLAWLWAYTKPVIHKLAYGTDKHDDYYAELANRDGEVAGELRGDVTRLRGELDRLLAKGGAPDELADIRDQLAALEPRLAAAKSEGAR
jgi:CBS domain containing-hemolysin-like protein